MSSDTPAMRKATRSDLSTLVALLQSDALDPVRPDDPGPPLDAAYEAAFLAIAADPNNALMVAELNGEIVGTLQLTVIQQLSNRGGRVAQIESVRVASPARNRGIGAAMLAWCVEEARRRGCFRLQLTTNGARRDAQRFYQRLGFSPSHIGMKLPITSANGSL